MFKVNRRKRVLRNPYPLRQMLPETVGKERSIVYLVFNLSERLTIL